LAIFTNIFLISPFFSLTPWAQQKKNENRHSRWTLLNVGLSNIKNSRPRGCVILLFFDKNSPDRIGAKSHFFDPFQIDRNFQGMLEKYTRDDPGNFNGNTHATIALPTKMGEKYAKKNSRPNRCERRM